MVSQGDQAGASRSLSPSELRTLYLDLLRRPAFDGERKTILLDLEKAAAGDPGSASDITGPTDLAGLTKALVASRDFWRQWFEEQLYYFLLVDNFAPRGETMLSIPDELSAGKLDVRGAIHRIALSSSFDQRNPGADTFVTVVMEQLGGLAVEKNRRELEIGKAVYDGKPGSFLGRAGSSQSDIVRNAIEQRSFAEAFLLREYRRHVHAAPDKRALGQWVSAFLTDPKCFPELACSWCASPAYEARFTKCEPMDNRLFVRALMVDLCQREPTAEEFSRMRSALDGLSDPQPLRSVMARMLLDSGQTNVPDSKQGLDSPGFIQAQFRQLLGRDPSDKEAAEFAAGLADSEGKPTLIVYALITSPEYQSY